MTKLLIFHYTVEREDSFEHHYALMTEPPNTPLQGLRHTMNFANTPGELGQMVLKLCNLNPDLNIINKSPYTTVTNASITLTHNEDKVVEKFWPLKKGEISDIIQRYMIS